MPEIEAVIWSLSMSEEWSMARPIHASASLFQRSPESYQVTASASHTFLHFSPSSIQRSLSRPSAPPSPSPKPVSRPPLSSSTPFTRATEHQSTPGDVLRLNASFFVTPPNSSNNRCRAKREWASSELQLQSPNASKVLGRIDSSMRDWGQVHVR